MKLARRIAVLEKGMLLREPVLLTMAEGRVETLSGPGDNPVRLLGVMLGGATPAQHAQLDLIRRSVGSIEPGGGHLVDLTRALLLSPGGWDECGEVSLESPNTA